MHWFNSIVISIGALISSIFGGHTQVTINNVPVSTSSSMEVVQNTPQININDQSSTSTEYSSVNRCTTKECFVAAIKNCLESQYESNSVTDILGSSIKTKIDFDLSQSAGRCSLNMKVLSYSIAPSQGLLDSMKGGQVIGPGPSDIYPKLNSDAQIKIVGKTGICNINGQEAQVATLFNSGSEITMIVEPDYSVCSGSLFIKTSSQSGNTQSNNNSASVSPKTVADCDKLSFDKDRLACAASVVKVAKDCDAFSIFSDKEICIERLAIKQKDSLICAAIAAPNAYDTVQSDCFGSVAAVKNDYQICSVNSIGAVKSDPQITNKMALECVKNYCSNSDPSQRWWGCSN